MMSDTENEVEDSSKLSISSKKQIVHPLVELCKMKFLSEENCKVIWSMEMNLEIETKEDFIKCKWKLVDFLSINNKQGYICSSPLFCFAGSEWLLQFYPEGNLNVCGYVVFQLVKKDDGPPKRICFVFRIKEWKGPDLDKEFVKDEPHVCILFPFLLSDATRRSIFAPNEDIVLTCEMKSAAKGIENGVEDTSTLSISGKRQIKHQPVDLHKIKSAAVGIENVVADFANLSISAKKQVADHLLELFKIKSVAEENCKVSWPMEMNLVIEKGDFIKCKWRLVDFLSMINKQDYICSSPLFHFDDSEWLLQFYSDGDLNMLGSVVFQLVKNDDGPPKRICFVFQIKEWKGPDIDKEFVKGVSHGCNLIPLQLSEATRRSIFAPNEDIVVTCEMKSAAKGTENGVEDSSKLSISSKMKSIAEENCKVGWSMEMSLVIEKGDFIKCKWKLMDFVSMNNKQGYICSSPLFHFDESEWLLQFYPEGDLNKNGFVAIQLVKNDEGPPKRIHFVFRIKEWKGQDFDSEFVKGQPHGCILFPFLLSDAKRRTIFAPNDDIVLTCIMQSVPKGTENVVEDPSKLSLSSNSQIKHQRAELCKIRSTAEGTENVVEDPSKLSLSSKSQIKHQRAELCKIKSTAEGTENVVEDPSKLSLSSKSQIKHQRAELCKIKSTAEGIKNGCANFCISDCMLQVDEARTLIINNTFRKRIPVFLDYYD